METGERGQQAKPVVIGVGDNPTRIWGMSATERLRRLATKAWLPFGAESASGQRLLVNLHYAFDPQLLQFVAEEPGRLLVDPMRRPVIANIDADSDTQSPIESAMKDDAPLGGAVGPGEVVHDEQFTLYNHQLRKRERPFLMRLTPQTRRSVERASYYAAYKGVTDILTKYLWPELAFVLTRGAARIGASPNMVTAVGAVLCVLAAYLFWQGAYWWGTAAGFGFMVLDTVDGKLARCTITSSKWGNIFDHGIDQVHPPFWWWAWAVGLGAWGLEFSNEKFALVMTAIVGGYVVQRAIEGVFARKFGMHIHVWEPIDSRFRLISARRNPNMVLLVGALVVGRPDVGLELVAWWTVICCVFHAARLVQAFVRQSRGGEIRSWIG